MYRYTKDVLRSVCISVWFGTAVLVETGSVSEPFELLKGAREVHEIMAYGHELDDEARNDPSYNIYHGLFPDGTDGLPPIEEYVADFLRKHCNPRLELASCVGLPTTADEAAEGMARIDLLSTRLQSTDVVDGADDGAVPDTVADVPDTVADAEAREEKDDYSFQGSPPPTPPSEQLIAVELRKAYEELHHTSTNMHDIHIRLLKHLILRAEELQKPQPDLETIQSLNDAVITMSVSYKLAGLAEQASRQQSSAARQGPDASPSYLSDRNKVTADMYDKRIEQDSLRYTETCARLRSQLKDAGGSEELTAIESKEVERRVDSETKAEDKWNERRLAKSNEKAAARAPEEGIKTEEAATDSPSAEGASAKRKPDSVNPDDAGASSKAPKKIKTEDASGN